MALFQVRPSDRTQPEADAELVRGIRAFVHADDRGQTHDLFAELVGRHQRRAARIAYHYLRDVADADEAVQDAFVKAFRHLDSFRDELPFEVWFTRILVNGCLDRLKARRRRARWTVSLGEMEASEASALTHAASGDPSPEAQLVGRETRRRIATAVNGLPLRQRSVFILSQYGGHSPREISQATGLTESTVRVHLFRALRKLRQTLGAADDR